MTEVFERLGETRIKLPNAGFYLDVELEIVRVS
jgi:hypothetical protein